MILFFLAFFFVLCVHECGHYCVARLFSKVKFTRSWLWNHTLSQKCGDPYETKWCVNLLPLGAYVNLGEESERDLPYRSLFFFGRTLDELSLCIGNFVFFCGFPFKDFIKKSSKLDIIKGEFVPFYPHTWIFRRCEFCSVQYNLDVNYEGLKIDDLAKHKLTFQVTKTVKWDEIEIAGFIGRGMLQVGKHSVMDVVFHPLQFLTNLQSPSG